MNYQQLTIRTTKEQVNFIEEVTLGLGALSVDYSDSFDNPILEPSVGETPLWDDITLKVLFAEDIDKNFILNSLQEICNTSGEFEFIADKNWQEECNKNFSTTQYGGNLWVCPSWEKCENLTGEVIQMDPGMAFGTGSHQTTSLCLEYLAQHPPVNKIVLDFGTGSGILAIAAKKLGASEVVAIDNDPQSIISATNNAHNNQVDIKISDNTGSVPQQVDVIIANILTPTLIELVEYFQQLLGSGGKIILSGILKEQEGQIITQYSRYFTNFITQQRDDWVLISADKI
jgi:ribosomal protein L11 methyltransferase